MQMTNYLENKLADHVLRGIAYAAPSSVYVALHTANPTETGNIGELTTAAMPGYVRKQIPFGAPTDGICASTSDINWNVTANATITHATIWDAATNGNPLFYGPIGETKIVANNDIIGIPSASLTAGFE